MSGPPTYNNPPQRFQHPPRGVPQLARIDNNKYTITTRGVPSELIGLFNQWGPEEERSSSSRSEGVWDPSKGKYLESSRLTHVITITGEDCEARAKDLCAKVQAFAKEWQDRF